MKRWDYEPLATSQKIWEVLRFLVPGDMIPPKVYIRDYENCEIPSWKIAEVEPLGVISALTLIDISTRHIHAGRECHVGTEVFCGEERTLGGILYTYYPGCTHPRHMFGDIRQHARQIVDAMHGIGRNTGYPQRVALGLSEFRVTKPVLAEKKEIDNVLF